MSQTEIGSEFSYNLRDLSYSSNKTAFLQHLNFKKENCLFLNSGKAAIKFLFEKILRSKTNRILLLSYICSSIIQPFMELGMECVFYNLDAHLNIDLWDLDRKLKEGTDAVYFINYFGFPQPKALQQYLLENKDSVTIIEDCT
ncbi:MAG: DegT/DnrJ/EryC1/StrS family aminotransferase, partial [Clostridiaceae bacterium]|nr:DegT/DnrJ/EryC1/StrS family aminotransferase [Clostridiaceae bacterium]